MDIAPEASNNAIEAPAWGSGARVLGKNLPEILAGNIGWELNLAIWRSSIQPPN